MEGTNGFSSFPDDYYKTWPFKISDEEVRLGGYLVPSEPGVIRHDAAGGVCGAFAQENSDSVAVR